MQSKFSISTIEAIFADIDGSTRGKHKFAKNLPSIAKLSRIVLGIPIFPVTARDLNGWFAIKDFNKVFGTRSSSWYHLRISKYFARRRFVHPKTVAAVKRYISRYGCAVLNNGGTIASLDGSVIFRHYTFQEDEKIILHKAFIQFLDVIDSIELSGTPGGHTKLFLFRGDEKRIRLVESQVPAGFNVYWVSLDEIPDQNQIPFSKFEEIFAGDNSSKIGISLHSPAATSQIIEVLDREDLEITSNEGSLTISTRGVNKRSGIEWIAKHLDLDLSKCVFIGNDHNDIPALTHPRLGFPIVVGNSSNIRTERLQKKYGLLRDETLIVETYDDLFKTLRPLLTSRKNILGGKQSP
jgi:hydroxymethylpyrimidine pyrophosphatase-like HAD family hydrolase